MNSALTLCAVLLGVYGLVSLLISVLVQIAISVKAALICAVLIPVIAVPFLGPIQQFVEALVAFGR